MSKVTFVVDFEDGKEPVVHAGMTIFGGSLVAVSWRDALEVAEKRLLLAEHENVHYADAAEMEIAALRQRNAELEARTLIVKLPDDGMDDCYDLWGAEHCRNTFDCGYNFSAVRHEKAIREACERAGIALLIEGE